MHHMEHYCKAMCSLWMWRHWWRKLCCMASHFLKLYSTFFALYSTFLNCIAHFLNYTAHLSHCLAHFHCKKSYCKAMCVVWMWTHCLVEKIVLHGISLIPLYCTLFALHITLFAMHSTLLHTICGENCVAQHLTGEKWGLPKEREWGLSHSTLF